MSAAELPRQRASRRVLPIYPALREKSSASRIDRIVRQAKGKRRMPVFGPLQPRREFGYNLAMESLESRYRRPVLRIWHNNIQRGEIMKLSRSLWVVMLAIALVGGALFALQGTRAGAQDDEGPGLIVYASDETGNFEIFTLDPETGELLH